ncbi:NAD(P)H-hydrate dehydratase [Alienimonas chondri]|uniref:ADP-dependent (S)-NAD(P)H-hydrate dehydratase n=1 Tax=Alienimonas chondri TaxID=2681879 RepID=A0ABX1VL71_9PLAN|nr:NAD(P)H-hydrate dehydratase [Alienimonas chondri]NNJ27782.1 Bifunctional NAD(P)H-hydrate repair enzyme Nnr [Alienimonas chondri]
MTVHRITPVPVTSIPRHPDRAAESHKGDYGRVLILAGSRGMAGAAALSGLGALRGGAGLVTVACPETVADVVTGIEPGLMTRPLPTTGGHLIDHRDGHWLADLDDLKPDVWAVGPGLGRSEAAQRAVQELWESCEEPAVFDADALNALADQGGDWADPPADAARVLTPHPGEFMRLLIGSDMQPEEDFEWTPENRESLATMFAREHNVVLLLKGSRTLVTDGERLFENRTGNPGMASGGCGDVLTGLIAALIGQGMEPFEAACCGAHLHGRAGDLAAAELSQPGMIASDLPRFLATAFADPGYD